MLSEAPRRNVAVTVSSYDSPQFTALNRKYGTEGSNFVTQLQLQFVTHYAVSNITITYTIRFRKLLTHGTREHGEPTADDTVAAEIIPLTISQIHVRHTAVLTLSAEISRKRKVRMTHRRFLCCYTPYVEYFFPPTYSAADLLKNA